MAMVAEEDLEMHQMDVGNAFLNSAMNEEVFMSHPEGFIKEGEEGLACKLNPDLHQTADWARVLLDAPTPHPMVFSHRPTPAMSTRFVSLSPS